MKKLLLLFAAVLMAGNMMAQDVIEIKLTNLEASDYGTDKMFAYSNNDYEVMLDIYTNFVWAAGQTFGLANIDKEFSWIKDKAQNRKYQITELAFVFGENREDIDITATGVFNTETISIHAVYPAPAEPTDLATLTAEVINNGTAVQVTSSDPDMYWKYNFMTYNAEDDPTEFVTIIDEEIRGVNDIFEDMAWGMYSSDALALVGSQTINVPEWAEEGDELSFYAFGFANKGDGTIKRATNVVFITHFVYNATPTALENIATDAKSSKTSKLIKNGKLVIIKDGKKYNVVGQQM